MIGIADRVVLIAGITTRPDEARMLQIARNVADEADGALARTKYLILDRDTKYTERIQPFIEENGTEVIRLLRQSPNSNAYAERFVHSIKSECLRKMLFVGQGSLRGAIREFVSP